MIPSLHVNEDRGITLRGALKRERTTQVDLSIRVATQIRHWSERERFRRETDAELRFDKRHQFPLARNLDVSGEADGLLRSGSGDRTQPIVWCFDAPHAVRRCALPQFIFWAASRQVGQVDEMDES